MTDRPTILLVEDDDDLRTLLQSALTREEYDITVASSGEEALRKMSILSFDLVITDIRLPGIDGVQLVRDIRRRWPDIVVLVLTAYPSLDSAVACLRAGVHDYLFKPCPVTEIRRSLREGLAKRQGFTKRFELLQALEQQLTLGLRALRGEMPASSSVLDSIGDGMTTIGRFVRTGSLIIDRERHEAILGETPLELTPTEFEILAYLAERAPAVVTPIELARRAMGYEADEQEARELVKWHIHHLRQKIEADATRPILLKNVRGVGYKIDVT
ncbi:MAG TPA: response regulator transcription factor [Anaerolineae bacterium]|nr:response regulator transcription factor [Anaerolineae bacterium]